MLALSACFDFFACFVGLFLIFCCLLCRLVFFACFVGLFFLLVLSACFVFLLALSACFVFLLALSAFCWFCCSFYCFGRVFLFSLSVVFVVFSLFIGLFVCVCFFGFCCFLFILFEGLLLLLILACCCCRCLCGL